MSASAEHAGLPQPAGRLLIVDDEPLQMRALCSTLELEGFVTEGFTSAGAALQRLASASFDVLMTDLMMPEMNGIDLLGRAREMDPQIVGILMTGHATIDTAVKSMQAGALDYIQKPFRLQVILPVISRALDVRRLRNANIELQQRVRERTRELEESNQLLETANQDLESFSYSVSHDLRSPLRAVRGYVEMCIEDHGERLGPEATELLRQAIAGAQRMDRLVEDLLAFARFSRQPLERRRVALKPMIDAIVRDLRARDLHRDVQVIVGDLGDCACDPSLLEQVFVNLLSNAWKFTRDRKPALIEVRRHEAAGRAVFEVRDNGAGFDMAHAGKLFGVFQRLHSVTQFDGTGVGLSIVQRIVQRHGGEISARAAPGEGATFTFTLQCDPTAASEERR